jgi:hypothetical protein
MPFSVTLGNLTQNLVMYFGPFGKCQHHRVPCGVPHPCFDILKNLRREYSAGEKLVGHVTDFKVLDDLAAATLKAATMDRFHGVNWYLGGPSVGVTGDNWCHGGLLRQRRPMATVEDTSGHSQKNGGQRRLCGCEYQRQRRVLMYVRIYALQSFGKMTQDFSVFVLKPFFTLTERDNRLFCQD